MSFGIPVTGVPGGAVDSVNGSTGNVVITKSSIGLGNVDDTSDANKPVSTAQASAIAVVQSDVDAHEALTNNPHAVTKTQVGLSNVDNTSDVNKPVSTAQASADTAVQNYSIARANHTGSQLASTVSDFDSAARTAVISQTVTNGVTNRSPSEDAVYDAIAAVTGSVTSVNGYTGVVVLVKGDVGLGNVDNTSDVNKPVSTAQALADTAVQNYSIARANHTGSQTASTISDFDASARTAVISQTVTNGVTNRSPSEDAVYDAIAAASGAVVSVNGYTGAVVLVKADIGLGNVDNTSDVNKPVSTAQQTAIDAITPMTTNGDLLTVSGGVKARIGVGATGQCLKTVGGAPAWENQKDLSKETLLVDDFHNIAGGLSWLADSSGTASTVVSTVALVDGNHPGVANCSAGTTIAGRAALLLGGVAGVFTSGFKVSGGAISQEWLIRLEDISTVSVEYSVVCGNTEQLTAFADGIYFLYDRLNSGVNWRAVTRSASTSTNTDTGVAVAEDTWVKLRIEINAAGTSVGFYINDVLVATNTTNIPAVAIAPMLKMLKSAGSGGGSNRNVYVDYFRHYQRFTSAR